MSKDTEKEMIKQALGNAGVLCHLRLYIGLLQLVIDNQEHQDNIM